RILLRDRIASIASILHSPLESELSFLTKIGVKDSKKLSAKKRCEVSEKIKNACQSYEVVIVSAKEIDNREKKRITMNRLEEIKMAEIINKLKPDKIYLDAADVNEKRFGQSIKKLLDYSPNKIISKHKGDDLFPIVSAASIIAKDKRDLIVKELNKKYGTFGSGYPSDKRTTEFIKDWVKEHKSVPEFVRKSWETTKKIVDTEIGTKKITDFFN
ncbi:MAG: ribonuclease HII, partial [Candidatus Hermodarchaeota archaeon]